MVSRCHGVPYFHFFFLFRTNGRKEHLDENDFGHGYGSYFESAILKVTWYRLCSMFVCNIYEAHWQRHLKSTLQLKILQKWINIRTNFSLGKYEMKMGEGVRKTIICTKVRAPFVKNISLITVFFFFSQTDLVFNFNLILIEQFSPQFIYLLTFWYFVHLFIRTSKTLMRLSAFF